MEDYQKANMPPPVPPKYHNLTSVTVATTVVCQKENVFRNGYHRYETTPASAPVTAATTTTLPASATGSALIQTNGMRVKIQINAENPVSSNIHRTVLGSTGQVCNGNGVTINANGSSRRTGPHQSILRSTCSATCNGCANDDHDFNSAIANKNIVNSLDSPSVVTAAKNTTGKYINPGNGNTNGFFYNISSGQSSPSDNLDSGTCSDVDTGTPPSPGHQYTIQNKKTTSPKITPPPLLLEHQRSGSLNSSGIGVDSEDEDDVSCDSINSSEYNGDQEHALPVISAAILKCDNSRQVSSSSSSSPPKIVFRWNLQHRKGDVYSLREEIAQTSESSTELAYEAEECDDNTDQYLQFHLNEKNFDEDETAAKLQAEDDSFAGFKSFTDKSTPITTIHSDRGTVRGVKNRVRAGIATFLNNNVTKTWQEKETGKVVVYTTTMGIVRETYHRCLEVKQILRTHLVKFEEKDVFMSREQQKELRERMKTNDILVPQVFVEGIHIGDAKIIDRLNESGELRRILKPYRSADASNTCQVCGGYRLLPCNVCNGSKKSARRPNFTVELVPLRCMNCDEVGLIKCYAC